jgi:hypothetical protein
VRERRSTLTRRIQHDSAQPATRAALFLALQGSVLPRILPALLVNIAIATQRRWRQSMTA